jgi:hypothetical protein
MEVKGDGKREKEEKVLLTHCPIPDLKKKGKNLFMKISITTVSDRW